MTDGANNVTLLDLGFNPSPDHPTPHGSRYVEALGLGVAVMKVHRTRLEGLPAIHARTALEVIRQPPVLCPDDLLAFLDDPSLADLAIAHGEIASLVEVLHRLRVSTLGARLLLTRRSVLFSPRSCLCGSTILDSLLLLRGKGDARGKSAHRASWCP